MNQHRRWLLLGLCLAPAAAFTPPASRALGRHRRVARIAAVADADDGAIAKEALKAELGGLGSCPDKAVVGEVLLALEACNPTPAPATSSLLNGKWRFLYATGASPGLKALQLLLKGSSSAPKSPSGAAAVDVADAFLTIGAEQPRAVSSTVVRVLSFESELKLSSSLEAESAVRLVETYEAAEASGGLRLPFQSPAQYKRSVLVSYLDDDILIVRDALGRADVLLRHDGAPSTVADAAEPEPSEASDAADAVEDMPSEEEA